jgi:hypothetical protein
VSKIPPKRIPEGIINARALVNELAKDYVIIISDKNPYWQETEISCRPFTGKISYSIEYLELNFEISVGRVFDSSAGEEIIEDLPVPVNYEFSLEPEPKFTIVGNLAVTPNTQKNEVWQFILNNTIIALMATQALMVTDSFTKDSASLLAEGPFPRANSVWDFGGLARKVLN